MSLMSPLLAIGNFFRLKFTKLTGFTKYLKLEECFVEESTINRPAKFISLRDFVYPNWQHCVWNTSKNINIPTIFFWMSMWFDRLYVGNFILKQKVRSKYLTLYPITDGSKVTNGMTQREMKKT